MVSWAPPAGPPRLISDRRARDVDHVIAIDRINSGSAVFIRDATSTV
jgi:hypothetical protein